MAKFKVVTTKGLERLRKHTRKLGEEFIYRMHELENNITEHECQKIVERFSNVNIVAYNDRRDKYQTEEKFDKAKHFFLYNKYAVMSYWMMEWRDRLMMAQQNPDDYKFDFGIQQKEEIYRKFRSTIKKDCNIEFRKIENFSVTLVNEPAVFVVVLVQDSKKVCHKSVIDILR